MVQRVLHYAWRYRGRIIIALISTAAISVLNALSIGTLQPFLDLLFPESGTTTLSLPKPIVHIFGDWLQQVSRYLITHRWQAFFIISGWLLIITALKGIFSYLQEYFSEYVSARTMFDIRTDLYEHLQGLSLRYFSKSSTGEMMSKLTYDVDLLGNIVTAVFGIAIREIVVILGLLVLLFILHWQLALISLILFPIGYYPVVQFGRRMRKRSSVLQQTRAEVNVVLQETISGVRVVKAFGMEQYESERFAQKAKKLFQQTMKVNRITALASPVMEFLGAVGVVITFWFGAYFVFKGQLTVGTFAAFLVALGSFYQPIRKLTEANNMLQRGLAGAQRVCEILDTPSDIKEHPEAKPLLRMHDCIEFKNVSFAYDKEPILHNINLTVKKNQIVAIVGASGVGKTTLVNLLPRFYDITDGAIEIDGQDIRLVTIKSLRDQFGIVTQETILFDDTVFNNIAYGQKEFDRNKVIAAAKLAHADEFIQRLPQGYETRIGERGFTLSGGERQRIALARAILKDPAILILDEATSALDTESERLIQEALDGLMRNRTTFIIAHRLSTVMRADVIIVLDEGKIVEQGTHTELLQKNGVYANLYRCQFTT
ncbi:MAG: ABC transporter ATP-binding protein/permease [bacterium]|nr:ABC transporter ATP-binding protein/permease [bacterium]